MSNEHFDKLVKAAEAQTDAFEALTGSSRSMSVAWEKGRLKENNQSASTASGIRVVKDGRISFATTTKPEEGEKLVETALRLSQFGRDFDFSFAPKADADRDALYDEQIEKLGPDYLFGLGKKAKEICEELAPDTHFLCDLGFGVGSATLANSNGHQITEHSASTSMAVGVEKNVEGDFLTTYDVMSSNRLITEADVERLSRRAVDDYLASKTHLDLKSGKYPLLLSPTVVNNLITPIMVNVGGLNVEKKISRWVDSVGQKVCGEKITLWDDPEIDGPSNTLWDGEGMLARKRAIIDKGTLTGFIHSRATAEHCGHEATGNAQRGVGSTPKPGFHNIVVNNGDKSLDELMNMANGGLFIRRLIGVFTSNFLAGQLSGNVMLGWKMEDGQRAGRVKKRGAELQRL